MNVKGKPVREGPSIVVCSRNRLTNRLTNTHAHTALCSPRAKAQGEYRGKAKGKTGTAVGTADLQVCCLLQICPSSPTPKLMRATTEQKYIILWKRSLIFMQVICFNGIQTHPGWNLAAALRVAQVGNALRVALLPELLLLNGELLRLVWGWQEIYKRRHTICWNDQTYYPLPIFCSESDYLHLHICAADGCQNTFNLRPDTQHWAAEHIVGAAAKAYLTDQPQTCFLAIAAPVSMSASICRWIILI